METIRRECGKMTTITGDIAFMGFGACIPIERGTWKEETQIKSKFQLRPITGSSKFTSASFSLSN